MDKSLIIIGKGCSVLRCKKEFVDSHDEVCIINHVIFEGYEHLISDRADLMFGNRTSLRYSEPEVKKLGLKKIFYTGHLGQKFDRGSRNIEFIYPRPNLHEEMLAKYDLLPSSGMQGLYYLLKEKKYNKISIVGFDFYEVGTTPYYFGPSFAKEMGEVFGGVWKGNRINVASGHDTNKSILLLERLVKENMDIDFKIISDHEKVNKIISSNYKVDV
jgi:hypothetical protein